MLEFENEKTAVRIYFSFNVQASHSRWIFDHDLGKKEETTAELIAGFMQKQFDDKIKELKKQAYLDGRKDQKNHQKIKDYFTPDLD